ncbi:YwmB family TATA-box binding protein [Halobacillus seohaensis]|uniref:YwmB family TATA-box binding protein n=1 Tax=Halobacillus seohaensis TaxID=447421 RepID=A0ABW2ELA1_9BACI
MKVLAMVLIAAIVIGSGVHPQGTAEGWSEVSPLIELAAFAEDEQLTVKQLNITLKESMKLENLKETEEKIKHYLYNTEITKEITSEATKYIYHDGHKNHDFVERFIVIIPTRESSSFDIVYTVTSEGRKSLSAQMMEQKADRIQTRIFRENVTNYSFIKSEESGILNQVLFYQKFKQSFGIDTIEESIEENWTSRSGYTSRWAKAIELPSGAMNVQFATRNLGNQTNITIGTPILTVEY